MEDKKLKIIDFSKGIRAEEIEHNFKALQQEINKERISVAGSGISYGFNLKLNGYILNISEGCLIDKEGQEVYINETDLEIEKNILISKFESRKYVDEYNRVSLLETPYADNRIESSDRVPISESGVSVKFSNLSGTTSIVNIASIENKILNFSTNAVKSYVDITYNYTAKRIDVVYIDKNYKIAYKKGITSTSPSVPKLSPDEYEYIITYLEIDGMIKEANGTYATRITIIKEFKSVRNLYTDKNNKLYICGTPFDSIKIIHTTEPKNPENETFWYDDVTNEIKVWRNPDTYSFTGSYKYDTSYDENDEGLTEEEKNANKTENRFATNIQYAVGKNQLSVYIDGNKLDSTEYEEGSDLTEVQKSSSDLIYSKEFRIKKTILRYQLITYKITRTDGFDEWVPINCKSFINNEERLIWTPEDLENEQRDHEHDLQFFLFDCKENLNMLFVPNRNALKVMINQIPLHSDQYVELTLNDIVNKDGTFPFADKIKKRLIQYYGYKEKFDPDNFNAEYENIGIGFMLEEPLDKECYIEAQVTQRVNSNPISQRFQRTATFIDEGSFEYKEYINNNNTTVKNDNIYKTVAPYRFGENQLEVYINGRRLENKYDYEEVHDINALKGTTLKEFKILESTNIKNGDRISYKITSNIYSYDHVSNLLYEFQTRLSDMEIAVNNQLKLVKEKCEYVDKVVLELNEKLESLNNLENGLNNKYLSINSKLTKDNLSPQLVSGIKDNIISRTYTIEKTPYNINVTGTCSINDYILVINTTNNRILQRDSDYTIEKNGQEIYLKINTASAENCTIHITGIKFN